MTSENEGRSAATGAHTAWRSTVLPDGNGHGSRAPEGSRAGPDSRLTGVNPAAGPRDPGSTGQLPRFLRAHLASILAITVAVTAGAALLARAQTTEYKSQATVVAYPSSTLAGAEAQASVMSTEQAVAQSSAVVRDASKRLRVPVPALLHGLSVSAPATSYLLNISYTNPSPQVAQRRAQAIARAYVAYRATTLRAAEKASRATAVAPQGGAVAAGIVNPASLPAAPSSPNRALDTGAGLILGIVLGLGFALARDRADDRLRGPSDLEERSGARVLAVIPGPANGLAVVRNPGSRSADAYRDLRIRVVQAAAWRDARTILVASPEREDEALVSANLAAALALAGRRVVLICADPRQSQVPDLFHLTGRAGLTSVFDGEATLADAIQRTEVPGLEVLLVGPGSGAEAAVTHTSELRTVISGIRARTDFVIMDAPGVLADPVPSVLAELADMVLLTVDARHSTRTSVLAAVREMERVHGPLDGCVLTHAGRRSLIAAQRSLTKARRSVARPLSQGRTAHLRLATSRVAGRLRRPARRPDLIRFPGRDPGDRG